VNTRLPQFTREILSSMHSPTAAATESRPGFSDRSVIEAAL